MSRIGRHITALIIGLVMMNAATSRAAPDVVVIASPDSELSSLTINQVADLFLGKITSLPGVGQVVPLDQREGSPVREEFYLKAARKSLAQLNAYWSRQIFTGKGEPPMEVPDTAAVKRLVASNPNVIGYIPKSALDGSVKPLLVIP